MPAQSVNRKIATGISSAGMPSPFTENGDDARTKTELVPTAPES
jgi:hypothetical protein